LLRLLWTCRSEMSCLHYGPTLIDLILVVGYASREGHSFLPLWWRRPVQLRVAEAAAIAMCCCIALPRRIVVGWCGWEKTPFPL
jgi:hypothetical protein